MLPVLLVASLCAQASEIDAQTALDEAVRAYAAGDPASARVQLQQLLALGPALDAGVRQAALAWLGDILYSEGVESAARNVFETLLAEAPDYPMDPFEHPQEVCTYFEKLRAEVVRPPPVPIGLPPISPPDPDKPAPDPWPALLLAPAGVYYYTEGRLAAGLTVSSVQLTILGLSAYTFIRLENYPPITPGDADELARFNRLVNTNHIISFLQIPAYLLPIAVETAQWGKARKVDLTVAPGGVGIQGTF